MKRIGFLSFGHWADVPGSRVPTASEAYRQAVELAVAAEEVGADGAFFRVHHFARQSAAPFPLIAAAAARTRRIELGTAVIDMRYENPLAMAEEAAITDLLSDADGAGGRLQLGISRGSPEPALRGWEAFGRRAEDGATDADLARATTELFRAAIAGAGVALSDPAVTGQSRPLPITPLSPGLPERIWWGAGSRATAVWTAEQGMNLMSSTLLTEDTGVPFGDLQAEQIRLYREAWAAVGHDRTPRVSVSRSIVPIIDDESRRYFGVRAQADAHDQVGYLDASTLARFGRAYIGEPDVIAEELAADAAVRDADTLLVTVPNQLGVDFNARLLEAIVRHVKPVLESAGAAVPAGAVVAG
ncbi:MAG: LLM class flavin-dependent oxidoreductase [Micrococcales bacterium]|nr:LLM class flavin-dependent oxidoreductase [Micrococcales bacterium]